MSEYSPEKGAKEHILPLPDGRQLAYALNGPLNSKTVIIFFSGLFSVGTAYDIPSPCRDINALWIAPTPIGMGNTSSRDPKELYHKTLARDTTHLLNHLYPNSDYDALYVAGGSYGTVPAQMLYGAPPSIFPAAPKLVGCMLMAAFSPIKHHAEYAKSLSWQNWISIGPPSQMPFRMVQNAFKAGVGSKMTDLAGTKKFMRDTLWDMMDEREQEEMKRHLERKGITEDEYVTRQAEGALRSVRNWDGFMEVADVMREDWGFVPGEEVEKRILIVGSSEDKIGGCGHKWLVSRYKGARERVVPGGAY